LIKLYLSAPIYTSSNLPHVPKEALSRPLTVVYTTPPVADASLVRSSVGTLPAQKIFLSAKYWVAKSPIGSLENTQLAPDYTILSSFSYIMFHSASTIS
jgi:hypothetical protein